MKARISRPRLQPQRRRHRWRSKVISSRLLCCLTMTTLPILLRWRYRTRLRSSSMPHGTTAAQASHETSLVPGISSHQRASSAKTRFRTRRFMSANCRVKLRRCRATRLSTRLCSRLMTRRRWLSVRQCRQLSRLKCGCMCWSSSARRPAQRNTGLNFGRLMTIITKCQGHQSSTIISSITTSR